jgi:hypothetical protein
MHASSWTVVEPSLPALTYTYKFGPGIANALAVPVSGGFAVVSPPCNAPDTMFTGLEEHGPVRALVAPNAFHSLGLAPWKARYPDVPIFAPAQSIPRLQKQTKLTGLRPVAEMKELLGDRVEIVDMPHYKTGEVLVRWRIEGGYGWYLTDVMFNMPKLPPGPFGLMMRWTRSGPGLRRNALAGLFMVKDKRALYGWLAEQAEKTPPTLLVACHGDTERPADPAAAIRAAVA